MKERRSPHRTQWAAQFAVASELCKRGYEVALTLGNHPRFDLMVISPEQRHFGIDVKGLYKKTYWPVRQQEPRSDLFYVFAFVPDEGTNRFFVLTQDKVNEGIQDDRERVRARAIAKGRSEEKADLFPCVSWEFVQPWENKW
jgi:hypothetical protein